LPKKHSSGDRRVCDLKKKTTKSSGL